MAGKVPKEIQLKITDFSKKGHGFGFWKRPDGSEVGVEVPFALPGEEVSAALLRKRGGVWQGKLLKVVSPRADRQDPRCLHFGLCGGCRWQHLPYPSQLEMKEEAVKSALTNLLPSTFEIEPIIPCDPPWAYRNKMEFSFSRNAAGDQFLGLNIDGGRGRVFNLTECHLVNPWFAKGVQAVGRWAVETRLSAYHPPSNTGALRTLTLREGIGSGDRLAMLTVSGNPDFALHKEQLRAFTQAIQDTVTPDGEGLLSVFLRIQQIAKGHPTQFYEIHLAGPDTIRETLSLDLGHGETRDLHFKISPSAFFQPNTRQAEKLYSAVVQMAKVDASSHVYDLYCGTGTLGICLAKKVHRVTAVELSPEAALDARTNAALNGVENLEVFTGDVGQILAERLAHPSLAKADLVVVDPPRAGLDDRALRQLLSLQAPQIIYVSCNPKTQAENLEALMGAGYHVEKVQPVDQFPQTIHIENIVSLRSTDS